MFAWSFKQKNNNFLPPVAKPDGSKTRIFVGISGGVDSSVSAAVLKKAGYDVTGVFMRTYYPPELKCDWRDERLDAMRVCEHLQIPFVDCDLESEYKNHVFDYMIESYRSGITPNPDVFCNKYVKFGGFLDWALIQGADYVATGHYAQHFAQFDRTPVSTSSLAWSTYKQYVSLARSLFPWISSQTEQNQKDTEGAFIIHNSAFKIQNSLLGMGHDQNKDQTYFLYQLQQAQLSKALFPIGHLEKSAVRDLAKKYGLFTAEKKDSQGLCFVGQVDMHDFLKTYINEQPGNVLDTNGQVIGQHDGAFFLTIGQRTGFEIDPAHRTPNMQRMFIVEKDTANNTVTVSADVHISDSNTVTLTQISWAADPVELADIVDSRIRHRGKLLPAKLELVEGDHYTFSFEVTHTGVAPGQSLVLYRDNICLGGGIVV